MIATQPHITAASGELGRALDHGGLDRSQRRTVARSRGLTRPAARTHEGLHSLDNHEGGTKMHQVIARYKVKPDRAEENLELVRAVYDELERTKPAGLRYATFLLDDGVSFVHIARADADPNPLPQVAAFQEFQREIADRCEEQPQVGEVQEVGAYRFFDRHFQAGSA